MPATNGRVAARTSAHRLSALDGLRGVAALVVVFFHIFLIAQPHLEQWLGPRSGTPFSFRWWLYSSPLSIFISGAQAVVVFFLLSGIVLTLPVLRAARYDWLAYYPRRIIRLYLPVIASVLLAVGLFVLVSRDELPVAGWQAAMPRVLDPLELLAETLLVAPHPQVNAPLWSLTWEMAFSLLLPIYVLIAQRAKRWSVWVVVLSVVIIAIGGELGSPWMKGLPVFLIGAIAAVNLDRIHAAARRIDSSSRHVLRWSLIFVASVLLITGSAFTASLSLRKPYTVVTHLFEASIVVGAMGIVFLGLGSWGVRRLLDSRPLQWLGRVSFGLYLTHVPILMTLAFAFDWTAWWIAMLVGVPVVLLGAEAFTRVIEQPAHLLSRRVGRRVSKRRGMMITPEAPLNDGVGTISLHSLSGETAGTERTP